MGCLFCAIVEGREPAAIVYRERGATAFLDVKPLFLGHVLVVPDGHAETLADLPPEGLAPLFELARRVSRALEIALGAGGSFVAINNRVSQSVPHLHVHVVPRTRGDGLRGFFWPRTRYDSDGEREAMAARIGAALRELAP